MSSAAALRLHRFSCVLLLIDLQERLSLAMKADRMKEVVGNVLVLLEAARRFGLPVVVSEQYPRGLGATLAEISEKLGELSDVSRIEKRDFSVCASDGFSALVERFRAQGRHHWIIAGMEAHICVYQSARDLVALGEEVQLVNDAVISRRKNNYRTGLALAEQAGAVLTSTECAVMDLLSCAEGEDFKAISKLIR